MSLYSRAYPIERTHTRGALLISCARVFFSLGGHLVPWGGGCVGQHREYARACDSPEGAHLIYACSFSIGWFLFEMSSLLIIVRLHQFYCYPHTNCSVLECRCHTPMPLLGAFLSTAPRRQPIYHLMSVAACRRTVTNLPSDHMHARANGAVCSIRDVNVA